MSALPARFAFGSRTLLVTPEPIEQLSSPVEGLVSSDDNWLSHGGGVSAALWAAAGPQLERAAGRARPRLRAGDVHVTAAGRLRARRLLHAITIDLDEGVAVTADQTPAFLRRVLVTAESAGLSSVALPLVGTGAAGLAVVEFAAALARALEAWLSSLSVLRHITVSAPGAQAAVVVRALRAFAEDAPEPVEDVAERATRAGRLRTAGFSQAWAALEEAAADQRAEAITTVFESIVRALAPSASGKRRAESSSPSSAVRQLQAFASERPDVVPPALAASLSAAAHVRSRIVHRQPIAWPDDYDTLARAVARGLAFLVPPERVSAQPEPGDATPASPPRDALASALPERGEIPVSVGDVALSLENLAVLGATARVAYSRLPDFLTPTPPESSLPQNEASDTAHVRRLQQFLLEHLDGEARADLDRRLAELGYQGSFDLRLLEYCVRAHPVNALNELLPIHRLRVLVRTLTGRAPAAGTPGVDLAQDLASHLGFPRPLTSVGLPRIAHDVIEARRALEARDDVDPAAKVNLVARRLEYLMKVLVRFLSQAVFDLPPERLLELQRPLARLGLGELFVAGERLQHRLADATDRVARVFERDVAGHPILPTGTGNLTDLRNSFMHFREESADPPRDRALRFLREAQALMEHLDGGAARVFPQVVRVNRIEVDEWNRRTVHVVDDEGRHESIFTDDRLEPGRVYFMHTLANPLRVDPILVPAGNLIWAE